MKAFYPYRELIMDFSPVLEIAQKDPDAAYVLSVHETLLPEKLRKELHAIEPLNEKELMGYMNFSVPFLLCRKEPMAGGWKITLLVQEKGKQFLRTYKEYFKKASGTIPLYIFALDLLREKKLPLQKEAAKEVML